MKLPTLCADGGGFCESCVRDPAWRASIREGGLHLPHACPRKLREYDGPALVVPVLAPFRGVLRKKPHQYRVTVALPHLNTPDLLPVVIDLLRLQTERPYILIVDTGSPRDVRNALEEQYESSQDVEVHSIRAKGLRHSSDLVCHAMDLAFARCPTDLLFTTHADAFLRRRNLLEEWAGKCDAATPFMGYGMSTRGALSDLWRICMGHVAAMYHIPTMDRLGVTWGIRRAAHQWGEPREQGQWPDTETAVGLALRDAGVKPLFVGREVNSPRQTNADFDHVRSTTGLRVFQPKVAKRREGVLAAAIAEARARAEEWRADDAAAAASPSAVLFHELWELIHNATPETIAGVMDQVRRRLPCGECRQHVNQWPKPDVSSLGALRFWGWERHDETNVRLGKPRVTYTEVARRRGW